MKIRKLIGRLMPWREPEKGSGKGPVDFKEKRQAGRVDVAGADRLSLHVLTPSGGTTAKTVIGNVKNISLRGCRLVFDDNRDVASFKPKQDVVASLQIEDFSVPLNLSVVRVIENREVAVVFKPPYPKELGRLEAYLQPRRLGMSIRKIDPSILQRKDDRDLAWFQGVNETSLFSWSDPATKAIQQQQLVFLEKVIEWKMGADLRTGSVRSDRATSSGGFGWVQSDLLVFDERPNRDVLKQGRIILESSDVDEDIKREFLTRLK